MTRDVPSSTILQLFSFQKTIYSLELNGVSLSSKVPWFCDDNGILVNFQEGRGRAKMGKIVRVCLACLVERVVKQSEILFCGSGSEETTLRRQGIGDLFLMMERADNFGRLLNLE